MVAVTPPAIPGALAPGFPLVRLLHLFGVSVLLGGAVLTWALLAGPDRSEPDPGAARSTDRDFALSVATAYERLFWAAIGLLAMTGVGNLGAFAPSLPGGAWGRTLDRKLLVVVLLLVGSAARAFLLDRCRRGESSPRLLRASYAATTAAVALVVVLAEVLAHG